MEKYCMAAIIVLVVLAMVFIAYTVTTDKIIKEQEREIAKLETENKRLKSALRGIKHVTKVVYSNKPIDYPATVKITKPQERMY